MTQPRAPRLALIRRAWAGAALAALAACSTPPGDTPAPSSVASQPAAQPADRPATPAASPAPGAAVATAAGTAAAGATPAAQGATVTVYKTPTCGCCAKWVDHMRAHGYTMVVHDTQDVAPVKAQLGVPDTLGSCHTATVNGYVLEGHVPAADVDRLLRERPTVLGIAVPGMPGGSPGMEVPGAPSERYDVVTFARDGARRVFASH